MKKKKTPPKEVHQPDDKIFKYLMKKKEGAQEYLRTIVPEWAKLLDLNQITYVDESFLIPELKTFDADSVHRCPFKDSEEHLNICFLWENKLQPEKYIAIQVGLYIFLSYYKMVKDPKRKLEPILPLIFYNGEKDWIPLTVEQLFENHPYFEMIRPFLPNFGMHFTNVQDISKEKLMQIQFDFFKSVMVAMANRHDWNLLLKEISVIFAVDDEDNQIAIGHYFYGIMERLPEEVVIDLSALNLDKKTNKKVMTTLEMFEKRGEIKGIQRGIKFSDLKNDILNILVCISKLPDLPLYAVAIIAKQPEKFVLKVKNGFIAGNEKNARKVVDEIFKDFGELKDIEKEQVEAIYQEYLPKFQKK